MVTNVVDLVAIETIFFSGLRRSERSAEMKNVHIFRHYIFYHHSVVNVVVLK